MPELPDLEVYVDALNARIAGRVMRKAALRNPFVLRTVDPPLAAVEGQAVQSVRRQGKRIVVAFPDALFVVVHLMIAGRLRWIRPGRAPPARITLGTLEFDDGTLALTEAGTKRRASLHVLRGAEALAALDPGGAEVDDLDAESFAARLRAESHTLKRALTDPRILSGIGNAYSDEILHRARLSPVQMTTSLSDEEITRLYDATRATLGDWTQRLRDDAGANFPEKVTAFREGMAVHGRFNQPCPVCGAPVQRIVYAENETNYCARCQTGGRLLADRALSRLLHSDWPKSIDDL
jgi:formamidopyrimidine-DNA glycosylase